MYLNSNGLQTLLSKSYMTKKSYTDLGTLVVIISLCLYLQFSTRRILNISTNTFLTGTKRNILSSLAWKILPYFLLSCSCRAIATGESLSSIDLPMFMCSSVTRILVPKKYLRSAVIQFIINDTFKQIKDIFLGFLI